MSKPKLKDYQRGCPKCGHAMTHLWNAGWKCISNRHCPKHFHVNMKSGHGKPNQYSRRAT